MRKECPESMRLSGYLDGEVDAARAAAIELHLAQCAECAALLKELQSVSTAVRGMPVPAVSPFLMARLDRHVDRYAWRGPQRLAGVLAALAASVAIVCGLQLMQTSQTSPAPETWERAAVRMTSDDSGSTHDASVAEWMVAGLGETGAQGE